LFVFFGSVFIDACWIVSALSDYSTNLQFLKVGIAVAASCFEIAATANGFELAGGSLLPL
jgi:hypothetical protein